MKKTILIILATILLAALTTAFLAAFNVHTSAEEEARPRAYESVEIQPNDTLWSISTRYCDDYNMTTKEYVKELKKVNGLTSDHIIAGHRIVVVKYASR